MGFAEIAARLMSTGGGSDFWRPENDGQYQLRIFRFPRNGELELFHERDVHFTGNGAPEECPGQGCRTCKTVEMLYAMGDETSKGKANKMRRSSRAIWNIVLASDPTGIKLWETPSGLTKKIIVLMAKAGGRSGNKYPKNAEEMPDFIAAARLGMNELCGPKGQNIVLTYDKNAKDKREIYDVDFQMGPEAKKPLPFEEANATDPGATIAKINEARAKKVAAGGNGGQAAAPPAERA